MAFLKKIITIIFNKYIIATIVILLWVIFFDKYNLIFRHQLKSQLKELKKDKKYYTDEIKKNKEAIFELTTDSKTLEKFAREKYLMKKDNEDIFVIVPLKPDSSK